MGLGSRMRSTFPPRSAGWGAGVRPSLSVRMHHHRVIFLFMPPSSSLSACACATCTLSFALFLSIMPAGRRRRRRTKRIFRVCRLALFHEPLPPPLAGAAWASLKRSGNGLEEMCTD
ncbi:hypothetical protein K438DRAFT_1960267 [Mycena galopus ATCC 62051]|nr:hypothetical protein K438DRAFT_1960267 [Mycena galopus ATCC 62051]